MSLYVLIIQYSSTKTCLYWHLILVGGSLIFWLHKYISQHLEICMIIVISNNTGQKYDKLTNEAKQYPRLQSSVTKWLDYLFNSWLIIAMKICTIYHKMPKDDMTFAKY